ncbi:MAG: hypothetical protein ACXU88_19665 [Myxococcaceae bacterium]
MTQRRSLIALLALGSAAAVVSCGSTDESALSTSTAASHATPASGGAPDEVEDGGVRGDEHARARVLLVRGGDVTFVGLSPRELRCLGTAADAGAVCPGNFPFSGTVIIRGASMSLLAHPGGGGGDGGVDDGGVVGVPDGGGSGTPDGGTAGGPLDARDGLLFAVHSHLFLPTGETGDAGVPVTGADGGTSVGSSARLRGGRLVLVIGGASGADGGVVEDGGVPGTVDGGSGSGSRVLRHIRDVRFDGATLHFQARPTEPADGG